MDGDTSGGERGGGGAVQRAGLSDALVKDFPNGVLVLFDADLVYRVVGPAVLPFSKRRADRMEGTHVSDLFDPATVAEIEPRLNATVAGDAQSFDVEYEGRTHHVETGPVTFDGDAYGVLVTQDVTADRRNKAELEREKTRLEQFASVLGHDLRNPLSVARGYLEIELDAAAAGVESTANLLRVDDALGRIDRIIEDLLTAAREGERVIDPAFVSLAAVAREAWSMVDTGDASLALDANAEVAADPSRLQRIFENLFRNAVEHDPAGGRGTTGGATADGDGAAVTVRVGPLDGGFYVEDDGPGIDAERREAVFEAGVSTRGTGAGFGLFIVRTLAAAHGWSVSVAEASTGGARFEFRGVDVRDGT